MFKTAISFNFSGLESATDFTFYYLINHFKKHTNKDFIDFNKILLCCCRYVSVWSLHYLSQSNNDMNLFDLNKNYNNMVNIIFF